MPTRKTFAPSYLIAHRYLVFQHLLLWHLAPTSLRCLHPFHRFAPPSYLAFWPSQVDTAENGQAALDLMKQRTYDIVFLDLEMPIMNGFSCSAAFREWESANASRAKRQPICVLSMHSGAKEKEMCAEVGVDFFEAKPAKIPGLMKIAELCVKLQNK
jgi:CheY-like chemotaxis protein